MIESSISNRQIQSAILNPRSAINPQSAILNPQWIVQAYHILLNRLCHNPR
jgi:hypothetical protein